MSGRLLSPLFRRELRATLGLAAPLALTNVLQMAVFASDVIFVAWLGEAALAASALAVAVFSVVMFALSGLTGAVSPLIAAAIGARRNAVREVRRSVRMALWLAVISAAAGMVLCWFGEDLMLLTGQDPELSKVGGRFLRLLSLSAIPAMIGNVLRIFVAAMGRPVFATIITAVAVVVNATGNWLFIYGHFGMPALGLEGSAVASIVTSFFSVCAYIVAIRSDRHLRRFHVFGRFWRPDWQRLREIVRIGVPIGLTILAEGGLFSSAAFLMGLIGATELAAHTVALQVAAFFFQVPFGVGQAATIRVGFHFGAGDRDAVTRAGWAGLIVGFAFAGLSACAMLLAPRFILSAYLDVDAPANVALVTLAVSYLAVGAAFQFADGAQAIAAGILRGLQDTRVPMIIAIAGYWLGGFATAAVLGLGTPLEGLGIWIGLAVGLVLVSVLLLDRWRRRERLGLLGGRLPPSVPVLA